MSTEPNATANQYRKRPVIIEARQLGMVTLHEIIMWMSRDAHPASQAVAVPVGAGCLAIRTLEGEMTAQPGDWIIKGVKGEFYPCKPDIFAATYEKAEADPIPAMAKAAQEAAQEAGEAAIPNAAAMAKAKAVVTDITARALARARESREAAMFETPTPAMQQAVDASIDRKLAALRDASANPYAPTDWRHPLWQAWREGRLELLCDSQDKWITRIGTPTFTMKPEEYRIRPAPEQAGPDPMRTTVPMWGDQIKPAAPAETADDAGVEALARAIGWEHAEEKPMAYVQAQNVLTAIRAGKVPGIWCGMLVEEIASAQLVRDLRQQLAAAQDERDYARSDQIGACEAMAKARREKMESQGDAMMWQASCDLGEQQPLLVRVWQQRRQAERERDQLKADIAAAKRLASDLICQRQGEAVRADQLKADLARVTAERDRLAEDVKPDAGGRTWASTVLEIRRIIFGSIIGGGDVLAMVTNMVAERDEAVARAEKGEGTIKAMLAVFDDEDGEPWIGDRTDDPVQQMRNVDVNFHAEFNGRQRAEAEANRLQAELAALRVPVKLPERRPDLGYTRKGGENEIYNEALDACRAAIQARGLTVEG